MSEHGNELSRRSVLKHSALATGSVVLGGVAASGTAAAGIGDGRVLDYHLNNINYDRERGEIVSNFVHDASPADNDGVWMGTAEDPVVKDGAVGNAFAFDGDGDYIDVDFGDGSEVILADWTVAGWINPSSWSDGDRKEWLSVSEDETDFRPLDFVHEDGAVKHYRGNAAGEVMSYDVSSEAGWHHMAVTQRRTDSSTVNVEMYFDGMSVDSNKGDYEYMRPSLTCFVGTLARSDDRAFYWDGEIDEVRVYDRVLSDSEIQDLVDMKDD